MNILDRVWEAYQDNTIHTANLQSQLDLSDNDASVLIATLAEMADNGNIRAGYRCKRISEQSYKLHTQDDSDSPKGKTPDLQNEAVLGQSERGFSSTDGENGENHAPGTDETFPDAENQALSPNMNIGCLLMPRRSEIPVFRSAQDKEDFDENLLWGWEYLRDTTPRDIIQYADAGRVFVPGQFVKCPEKRRFRHTKSTWQGTQLIACDADQIKGIEFDNEGNDKTPEGVDAFTDPKRLLELYPTLQSEAYAIGHSLSSLSKPPPHIRCRIYFVLEHSIRSETDYKWLLLGLSTVYRIISASRQPAQPVYGNAGKRRIFKDEKVQELTQPFQTRIFDNLLSAERMSALIDKGKQAELDQAAAQQRERHRENEQTSNRSDDSTESFPLENQTTLTKWLTDNNIPIRGKRDEKYLFVDCPWENQHTSDFGAKDTAVWEDHDFGFCFHCLHEHCKSRHWEDYRQAVAPRQEHRHGYHTQRSIYRRRDYR